jgi:hypothetical protein
MFKHYIKVAFRNLWKYKSQTLTSVIGLAVGFTCFALATLWIRYEMTFDSFHKNASHLYRVSIEDKSGYFVNGLSSEISSPLSLYLKNTFPEIKNATKILSKWMTSAFTIDSVVHKVSIIHADASFLDIFDIKVIEGDRDFMIPESQKIAITQKKARQLFGNESPVGKIFDDQYTIGAVISGFSKHSNYPFDFLLINNRYLFHLNGDIIVELGRGFDTESFRKKLYEHKATYEYTIPFDPPQVDRENIEHITLMPLTSIHYKDPYMLRTVQFQHIIIFAMAGSLLILCTLLNYLALFISRFRIRQRELALRIVCGASNRSLFALLSVEFIICLTVALVFSECLIHISLPYFRVLTETKIEHSTFHINTGSFSIHLESLIYIAVTILVSLLTFLITLYIFRRKSLNVAVRGGNKKIFRKVSIIAQLTISIVFTFCTIIILKQIYYLHNTDLGFAYKGRGYVCLVDPAVDVNVLNDHIKQIPEITETVAGFGQLTGLRNMSQETFEWEIRPGSVEHASIDINRMYVSEQFAKFYELKLVAGEMLNESDTKEYVLINESAAKIFGWDNPVGKTLDSKTRYVVKGVIKNICHNSPVVPVEPTICEWKRGRLNLDNMAYYAAPVLFKYSEGTWKTCREKIEKIIADKYPDILDMYTICNEEKEYDKFLKSENALLKILTLISLVCVTVCIFGFVSIVSLTCEERRKEIAIRKVNGATVKDILDIFLKEYLILLGIGALLAFPIGYLIMKRWLEQYILQTEINAWIYVSILLALIMIIVLCIGKKVYRTSRENPVNSLK